MRRICEFIGVPFESNCTLLVKQDRHNICGSLMRFDKEKTAIKLDESWKTKLTHQDKKNFRNSGAGLVNWLLGYR